MLNLIREPSTGSLMNLTTLICTAEANTFSPTKRKVVKMNLIIRTLNFSSFGGLHLEIELVNRNYAI